MRGLMAKPQKKLTAASARSSKPDQVEFPRRAVGARVLHLDPRRTQRPRGHGVEDADAGYLTRRLVDVAQDVTVTEEDCGTISGSRCRR